MNAITSSGRKVIAPTSHCLAPMFVAALKGRMKDDAMSREGADILCKTIRGKWLALGLQVNVEPIAIHGQGNDGRSIIWVVRSDLVNGLPRRRSA